MATGTKRDCRGVNCWRQLYRPTVIDKEVGKIRGAARVIESNLKAAIDELVAPTTAA